MVWMKRISIVVAVALVMALGVGAFVASLYNKEVDKAIEKISTETTLKPKPEEVVVPEDPRQGESINILLLGSDSRSIEDPGRTDSIMVAHVPSDRKNVYLISIPRDLAAEVPGYGTQKINAAYAYGGAPLTVNTVSTAIGVPIDHVAIIDFQGFIDLVDALGGVTINNPYEACDLGQDRCWEEGPVTLTSEDALSYVRWRKGLPNGDITRGQNQQRVLKSIVGKLLSKGTLTNPARFGEALETLASHITVDDSLDRDTIKGVGFSMRITGSDDIRSITYPISGYYDDPVRGSMNLVNEEAAAELKDALQTDTFEKYWLAHKNDPVAGNSTVEDDSHIVEEESLEEVSLEGVN